METQQIQETIQMIREENLDIRTITMGISLLDCVTGDMATTTEKVYAKIVRVAADLVPVANAIENEYGIPIVNKRIAVTPVAMLAGADPAPDFGLLAKALDDAAKAVDVDLIGGFTATVQNGCTKADWALMQAIPAVLAATDRVCASVNVGSTRSGLNMDAIKTMGEVVKQVAAIRAENAMKLVIFANAVEDNPFMAGAFWGVSEGDVAINTGVSGPGVVQRAIAGKPAASFGEICELIKQTAFKVSRMGQFVGKIAASRLNVPFNIVDLSLAPTPAAGDSVAEILETLGLSHVGTPGTTAALALLNDAVKKGGIMAAERVGGLSGAFIPVSEDANMIRPAQAGQITLEKLEAMTAVCSVGLDMVAVPGDTPATTISGMIADEAAIGMINNKTTAVRVIPVPGKGVGDSIEFGGLFGVAPIMPVNTGDASVFINRGGRIPAPIHSFKN
ncbi:PFL family protein [Lacticaseibacillus parakribbianus]|uniref:PFL family protein n=1 Tax=Lacticaseibacillus parakribbianus TaxID=2970927 RepID=UPI0021CAF575|nr:PFL family protein [Lacticaseibacillus parakribbianus]